MRDGSLVDTAYHVSKYVNSSCPDCLVTAWPNIKEIRPVIWDERFTPAECDFLSPHAYEVYYSHRKAE